MEAFGVVATLIQVADIAVRLTAALVEYTKDVKNASVERQLLATEAGALGALMRRLAERAKASQNSTWLQQKQDIVDQFSTLVTDFARLLNVDVTSGKVTQRSRFKTILNASKWSFSKCEVYALLERMTRMQSYADSILLDEQSSLVEKIDETQQQEKQRGRILASLSPLQMGQMHQTLFSRIDSDCGKWFLDSDPFVKWKEEGGSRLLCTGIPGAGKTVIASLVVDHLRNITISKNTAGAIGIAYVYLRYNEPLQTLDNLLGSMLKQLLQTLPTIPSSVLQGIEEECLSSMVLTLETLVVAFHNAVAAFKRVFLILDALDECPSEVRWELIEVLRQVPTNSSLLVTSRVLDGIDEDLGDFARTEIKAHRDDMEIYIDSQIKRNRNLRRVVEKSRDLRRDIKDIVVKTSEDMFLLARLHVESLVDASALSISHVRKKLQSLPHTLDETYNEALVRIEAQPPEHTDVALKTLAWVSYAFRALSFTELQHALAIEPGQTVLDREMLMDAHSITGLCAGLVVIDPVTNVVNLVHYTAKKHFETIRLSRFPGFHGTITASCATYLGLRELQNASISTMVRGYPLACYGAQYIGDHARQHPEETLEASVLQVICQLLSNPEKRKPLLSLIDSLNLLKAGIFATSKADLLDETSLSIEDDDITLVDKDESETIPEAIDNMDTPFIPEVTALHLAASMGLARVASLLLNDVPDVDAVDETGKTALTVAMERGFEKAVAFLINSGASVDLRSSHGKGVFLLMVENGWHAIADVVVQRFLTNSETVHDSDDHSGVKAFLAAYLGDDSTIFKLAVSDCAANPIGADSLFMAVECDRPSTVKAILDAGVDAKCKDTRGDTALHRSTRRGLTNIMDLLLSKGAEVDQRNDEGRTPWSANLRTLNRAALDLLLRAGANPNTKGQQGVSEIYVAAENGEAQVLKYMLESGTDPSIKTQFLWAPLHWASYFGHLECVKMLLQYGAETSPVSDQDATPLDLALRANQTVIANLLRSAGAKESREVEAVVVVVPDDWSTDKDQIAGTGEERHKLSLTFDKPIQQGMNFGQFVYPSSIKDPKDFIYEVSRPLTMMRQNRLSIRKTTRRADMVDYPLALESFDVDDALFDIERISTDYQTLELHPRIQCDHGDVIKMHQDWTGGWKVRRHDNLGGSSYLFRTTPDWSKMKQEGCRWTTEDGTLVARTGLDGVTPVITLEHDLPRGVEDIIVSCWVAKLWAETVALQ